MGKKQSRVKGSRSVQGKEVATLNKMTQAGLLEKAAI